jgi:hypothetical protein
LASLHHTLFLHGLPQVVKYVTGHTADLILGLVRLALATSRTDARKCPSKVATHVTTFVTVNTFAQVISQPLLFDYFSLGVSDVTHFNQDIKLFFRKHHSLP